MSEKTAKELRAEWVKVLRSGEYNQSREVMADENGYCCIGVAGTLIGITNEEMIEDGEYAQKLYEPIRHALGYSTDIESTLIDCNDTLDYDFNQIADFIESKEREGAFIDVQS